MWRKGNRIGAVPGLGRFCRGCRRTDGCRGARRDHATIADFCEKAVASASDGFDKAGTGRRVSERLTDLVDRFIEAMVEVHERVGGPECLVQGLASDNLAAVLDQD